MAKVYKVYICHSWDHVDDLEKLRNLLNQRGYFNVEFKEHSPNEPINSSNATYIKQRLKNSILDTTLYASDDAKMAFWVILPILGSGSNLGWMLRLGPVRAAFGLEDLFGPSKTHAQNPKFWSFWTIFLLKMSIFAIFPIKKVNFGPFCH